MLRPLREGAGTGLRRLFEVALRWGIVRTSLKVALMVGTILNLLNHWQLILGGMPLPWLHVVANYLVPYCVSSYSAARNELTRSP
jgi:hypothetical protein